MNIPYYILSAIPKEKCKIKSIFESRNGSIMQLLRNPGSLRYGGWDLRILDFPRIVKGEYLEIGGERRLIHLYEDGTLIFRVSADHKLLGWPRRKEEFKKLPRINSLALIEITLNFVNFYKTIVSNFDKEVNKIQFRAEFRNIFLENNKRLYLLPYSIKHAEWDDEDRKKCAPENNMKQEIIIDTEHIKEKYQHVTYEIIKKIYLWFSLSEDEIPYSSQDKNDKKYIDENLIKKN